VKAGWQAQTLGDVLRLEYGKPLDRADRKPNGLYPVYGANGEKDRTDTYYCGHPSIIVGRKGSAGEVTLSEEKFWPLDVTYFAEFDRTRFDLQFLHYLLVTLELPNLAKGVKPGINRNEVYALPVHAPALAEQQRIVGILDEAFDGIATAKGNAEKNLQNARALFESHLQSVFTQRGEGWPRNTKSLADLCELIVDCEHKTAPTQEIGIPSIRTPNIGKSKLLLDGVYRVSEETYREWTRRAEPRSGDLILAREAPAGNVAVIPDNLKVCLGQRTVLIRPRREVFEPEFLALTLLQPQMQQTLLAHSRGATVQHVNMKDIRALLVDHIPSLVVQSEIVALVKKTSEEIQRLESLYQRKLTALDELKKSLLHQAFSGAL
jgi:type I restriction enzyme, S subunit